MKRTVRLSFPPFHLIAEASDGEDAVSVDGSEMDDFDDEVCEAEVMMFSC